MQEQILIPKILQLRISNPPASGSLMVNNQMFAIETSPQDVTLAGLSADGNVVDAVAKFADDVACTYTNSSAFTAPVSCSSGGGSCTDYIAGDLPMTIVGGQTTLSTINSTQTGSITDINIKNLNGDHTWVGDMVFILSHVESGKSITLIDSLCGSQEDFNLNLDDGAASNILCPLTGMPTYKPFQSLSTFNGESATATWTMTVLDFYEEDDGMLNGWTIEVCTGGTSDPCNQTSLAVDDTPITSDTYKSSGYITS